MGAGGSGSGGSTATGQAEPAPPLTVSVAPPAAASSQVTIKKFSTSRKTIRNRGKKLTSTIIKFRLSRATVLVFEFRGPGPGCAVAARISAVGLAGLNRFRFHGYIGKRPFASGTYSLIVRQKGSKQDLARSYLTIVAPGVQAKPRVRPKCERQAPTADLTAILSAAPLLGALVGDFQTPTATPRQNEAEARTAASDEPREADGATEEASQGAGDVLGEQTSEGGGLPELPVLDEPEGVSGLLAILLLALLLASLLGTVFFVVQHLRRSGVES